MPNYTANYQLHQWLPGDNFLRTDFNTDFTKIDAALQANAAAAAASDARGQHALDSLEPLAYNLYSLLLQNYYDGKYTGYKKALVFDGFRDDALYGSRSAALLRSKDRLVLTSTGQTDISLGYSSNAYGSTEFAATQAQTLSYNGTMTGWTVKVRASYQTTSTVYYQILVNGSVVRSGSVTASASTAAAEFTCSLSPQLPVAAGDSVQLAVKTNGSDFCFFRSPSGQVGGVLRFSPLTGTTGQHTSSYVALPARSKIVGWVRHDGCAVTMDVLSGGQASAMTQEEQRSVYTLGQTAYCRETAFILNSPPDGASLAFRINLTLSGSSMGQIYDYGVVVL